MTTKTPKILPEYESVEAFVEFCIEDERDKYDHEDLTHLSVNLKLSPNKIRKELEEYGLTLKYREKEKDMRGFNTNDHDRWYGPGADRSHGGSGQDQISGFAGREG